MAITISAGAGNSVTVPQLPNEVRTVRDLANYFRPLLRYGDNVVVRDASGVALDPSTLVNGVISPRFDVEQQANTKGC